MTTAASEIPPLMQLLRADYAVLDDVSDLMARMGAARPAENPLLARLNAPRRFLMNSSLRAALLIRLCARSSRRTHWLWRSVLLWLHSCDVMPGARIGPGLRLPHPHGITIGYGVVLGENVTLAHNVTLGTDMRYSGHPSIGNGVRVLSGSVVAGPVHVGDGALIGANCLVLEDVPAGGRVKAAAAQAQGPQEAS